MVSSGFILIGIREYAIFPRARSPISAKSFGIANRDIAREWIKRQIKKNVMDGTWTQAPNLSKIADIFARTFLLMGKCRFPLYISKTTAEGRFDIWRMINEQRMARNARSFVGVEAERNSLHPTMASFRRIAERNQAKARRRYLRAGRLTPHG